MYFLPRFILVGQSDPPATWSSPSEQSLGEPPSSKLFDFLPVSKFHLLCDGTTQVDDNGQKIITEMNEPQLACSIPMDCMRWAIGHDVGRQRRSSAVMTSPPKTPSRSKCSRALQSPYREHLPAITRDTPSRGKATNDKAKYISQSRTQTEGHHASYAA